MFSEVYCILDFNNVKMAGVKEMDQIQNKALHMALAGHNVLVTGFPGTGKSFVISEIAQNLKLSGKVVAVTATTGKAAQVLQGKIPPASKLQVSTVHKFLGLKDGRYSNEELVSLLQSNESLSTKNKNIKTIDCLIIDEISMLSTKLFEQIECVLSEIRQTPSFGGVQLILSGDFFQLPPVANPSYGDNGSYCFLSRFIRCLHHVQLTEMHRQSEPDLIAAIHQSARGQITEDTFNLIKRLKRTLPPGPKPLKLFAMNLDVEIYNSECLLEMEGI
ncbi:PIF1 [Mytilus edulis]|uniref:ATP-dependent DNA helicase n=1 Tax=Mytilus edulis TaxID=6550 RepID=A0A8S3SV54_MYTED|nr:PIF1 [Mytilus edulis]